MPDETTFSQFVLTLGTLTTSCFFPVKSIDYLANETKQLATPMDSKRLQLQSTHNQIALHFEAAINKRDYTNALHSVSFYSRIDKAYKVLPTCYVVVDLSVCNCIVFTDPETRQIQVSFESIAADSCQDNCLNAVVGIPSDTIF